MRKWYLILAIIVGVAVLVILFCRFLTPEDSWIKDANGVWIKHGNPAGTPPLK